MYPLLYKYGILISGDLRCGFADLFHFNFSLITIRKKWLLCFYNSMYIWFTSSLKFRHIERKYHGHYAAIYCWRPLVIAQFKLHHSIMLFEFYAQNRRILKKYSIKYPLLRILSWKHGNCWSIVSQKWKLKLQSGHEQWSTKIMELIFN